MRVERSDLLWNAIAIAAGAVAAAAATRLMGLMWKRVTGGDPPLNRVRESTTRGEEIAWVVASGVAVALSRFVARRGAALAWKAKTGDFPRSLMESSNAGMPDPAVPVRSL